MKVKVYYEAVIDIDDKYHALIINEEEGRNLTEEEEVRLTTEMIDNLDNYISQNPTLMRSTGMIGIDCDIDWDW